MRREDGRRLFFALWPSDALRAEIRDKTHEVAAASRGRLIPPANFHVTVLFLGDVLHSRLEVVQSAGAETALVANPFELSLSRIESWSGSNLLCLTATSVPPALAALVERLQFSLLDQEPKPRREEFRPHVTLARDQRRRQPATLLPASVHWRVSDFVLVDSQLGRAGSAYTVIGRWSLRGTSIKA